ncbi:hypothetical protein [Streptosporangium sp. CA-115845]|uniref:hypothetical protein n=1 Tax=Streptosporangium sp. CA-115845 TaxID=3240071 RepID=UPI003D913916
MAPEQDGFSTAETLANEPSQRRALRFLMLAAATALVVVPGAGAAAFSPSSTSTPMVTDTATPSAAPSEKPSDKAPGQGHRMGFGGHPIHGEFVVPDRAGRYVTVAAQYGDVTTVSQDSITVKSEDGYTKEYVINSDTRINRGGEGADALKTGQRVVVMAKVDGGTATAVKIHDVTPRDGQGRHGRKDEWHDKGERQNHDQQPGQTPTPTS